jgi:hypothetical protein
MVLHTTIITREGSNTQIIMSPITEEVKVTTDLNSTESTTRRDMTSTDITGDNAITMNIIITMGKVMRTKAKAKECTCTKLWTTIPAKNHSGLKNTSKALSSTAKEFLANVIALDMAPSKRPRRSAAQFTKSNVRHPPTSQKLPGIWLTGAKRVMIRITLKKDIMTKEDTMKNIKESTTVISIMTGSTQLTTNNIMVIKTNIMKSTITNTNMAMKTSTTNTITDHHHRLITLVDVLSPD